MKFNITLDLPNFEADPQSLPAVLHKLARTIESDHEPDVHPMDGSLDILDYEGNKVGLLEFEYD